VAEANRLRAGQWQGSVGQQLLGQRLGVWSYGRIGSQVAAYGRAFGMRVWAWGRAGSTAQALADGYEVAPSREAFLAESDVISLHVRLNAETRGMVTPADLERMKPTALLVNTSRAELVAPHALAQALRQGRPGFAAVDVYEDEPVLGAAHPLLALPNALCTPHLGYVEHDNFERYFGMAFDNINHFAAGRPSGLVNPEALARAR
jgi:D-3-phosphoglycerate dehydrogenase